MPENVLSIVKILGQSLSSLNKLILAVDSFDFYTPKRHELKSKNLLSFDSINGNSLVSCGLNLLLHP